MPWQHCSASMGRYGAVLLGTVSGLRVLALGGDPPGALGAGVLSAAVPGAFLCCRYQVPMDAERRWDICLRRLRSYGVCWTPLLTWGFAGAPHSNREDSTFGKTDVHRLLSVCTADWAAPFLSIEDTQCCHSPPTWKRNYGRRNPSEKNHLHDQGQRRPESRTVPLPRSRRPHHRRPSPGHRSQPQTNLQDRKNPNPKARPAGQTQESPADSQEHQRRQPHPEGAARLGTHGRTRNSRQ